MPLFNDRRDAKGLFRSGLRSEFPPITQTGFNFWEAQGLWSNFCSQMRKLTIVTCPEFARWRISKLPRPFQHFSLYPLPSKKIPAQTECRALSTVSLSGQRNLWLRSSRFCWEVRVAAMALSLGDWQLAAFSGHAEQARESLSAIMRLNR